MKFEDHSPLATARAVMSALAAHAEDSCGPLLGVGAHYDAI